MQSLPISSAQCGTYSRKTHAANYQLLFGCRAGHQPPRRLNWELLQLAPQLRTLLRSIRYSPLGQFLKSTRDLTSSAAEGFAVTISILNLQPVQPTEPVAGDEAAAGKSDDA